MALRHTAWILMLVLLGPRPVLAERTLADVPIDASMLVVSFRPLTPEIETSITASAQKLGKKAAFVSVLENGGLNLQSDAKRDLLRQFKGESILLVNSEEKTDSGAVVRASDFLRKSDLIRGSETLDVRFLVANQRGTDLSSITREPFIPTETIVDKRYPSIKRLREENPADISDLHEVQALNKDFLENGARAQKRIDPTLQTGQVFLNDTPYSAQAAAATAAELQKELESRYVGRRVVTVPQGPKKVEKPEELEFLGNGGELKAGASAELFQKHVAKPESLDYLLSKPGHGSVLLLPTVSDLHPNVMVADTGSKQLGDPAFFESDRFLTLLANGQSSETKLRQLQNIAYTVDDLKGAEQKAALRLANDLIDSILVDLASEQVSALKGNWKEGLSNKELIESLPQMKLLLNKHFEDVKADSEAAKLYTRLIAGVGVLSQSHNSGITRVGNWFNPMRFYRRAPSIASLGKQAAAALRKRMFGERSGNGAAVQTQIAEHAANYKAAVSTAVANFDQNFGREWAVRRAFMQPLFTNDLVSDVYYDFERALSAEQLEKAVAKDAALEAQRASTLADCAKSLRDLAK